MDVAALVWNAMARRRPPKQRVRNAGDLKDRVARLLHHFMDELAGDEARWEELPDGERADYEGMAEAVLEEVDAWIGEQRI